MLQPQHEADLHDLRNSPTHKRERPWIVRLAWIVWDVWSKSREIGLGLSKAWGSIHRHDRELDGLRSENAALRDRMNELDARTQHLRIYDETRVA